MAHIGINIYLLLVNKWTITRIFCLGKKAWLMLYIPPVFLLPIFLTHTHPHGSSGLHHRVCHWPRASSHYAWCTVVCPLHGTITGCMLGPPGHWGSWQTPPRMFVGTDGPDQTCGPEAQLLRE